EFNPSSSNLSSSIQAPTSFGPTNQHSSSFLPSTNDHVINTVNEIPTQVPPVTKTPITECENSFEKPVLPQVENPKTILAAPSTTSNADIEMNNNDILSDSGLTKSIDNKSTHLQQARDIAPLDDSKDLERISSPEPPIEQNPLDSDSVTLPENNFNTTLPNCSGDRDQLYIKRVNNYRLSTVSLFKHKEAKYKLELEKQKAEVLKMKQLWVDKSSNINKKLALALEDDPLDSEPSKVKKGKRVDRPFLWFRKKHIEQQATAKENLVPIRIDLEVNGVKVRDTFTWNLNESIITPTDFAKIMCSDLQLPSDVFIPLISKSIEDQLNEYNDYQFSVDGLCDGMLSNHRDLRAALQIDILVDGLSLKDEFEFCIDPAQLTEDFPERFARSLCSEYYLNGEFVTAVAHAVREQLYSYTRSLIMSGYSPYSSRLSFIDSDLSNALLHPISEKNLFRHYVGPSTIVVPTLIFLSESDADKFSKESERDVRRKRRQAQARKAISKPDCEPMRTQRTVCVLPYLSNLYTDKETNSYYGNSIFLTTPKTLSAISRNYFVPSIFNKFAKNLALTNSKLGLSTNNLSGSRMVNEGEIPIGLDSLTGRQMNLIGDESTSSINLRQGLSEFGIQSKGLLKVSSDLKPFDGARRLSNLGQGKSGKNKGDILNPFSRKKYRARGRPSNLEKSLREVELDHVTKNKPELMKDAHLIVTSRQKLKIVDTGAPIEMLTEKLLQELTSKWSCVQCGKLPKDTDVIRMGPDGYHSLCDGCGHKYYMLLTNSKKNSKKPEIKLEKSKMEDTTENLDIEEVCEAESITKAQSQPAEAAEPLHSDSEKSFNLNFPGEMDLFDIDNDDIKSDLGLDSNSDVSSIAYQSEF
ncbi:SWI/SNF-related matrix-associated actin-dependent regulator of chromatin subfamily B member 1-A, partial [Smittium culicis]